MGPDGTPLSIADLPPKSTTRWVARRKAQVVAAVRGGLLSLREACERYDLTVEEFLSWRRSLDRHGLKGLKTTRIQAYRAEAAQSELPDNREEHGDLTFEISQRESETPAMSDRDRRSELRLGIYLHAQAVAVHRGSSSECLIRDLSIGGCKIVSEETEALPNELVLRIQGLLEPVRSQLVWQNGDTAGVEFLRD